MNDRELRILFLEVIQGFSETPNGYIKHFSLSDQVKLDFFYNKTYNKAIENKILPEKDKINQLISFGSWSQKDDNEIISNTKMLENLQKTKDSLMLKSQKIEIQKQIDEIEAKLNKKLVEKYRLLGITAEVFTNRKLNNEYLFLSFFKDKELKFSLYTREEFDEIEDEEIDKLDGIYKETMAKFGGKNIRKLSLMGHIQNSIKYISGPRDFLGKAFLDLTFYQNELFTSAKYFNEIFSNYAIPELIQNDPDKIVEFVKSGRNLRDEVDKLRNKGMDVTLVGASKDDFETAGLKSVDLTKSDKNQFELLNKVD
jgi:hypothetical protein